MILTIQIGEHKPAKFVDQSGGGSGPFGHYTYENNEMFLDAKRSIAKNSPDRAIPPLSIQLQEQLGIQHYTSLNPTPPKSTRNFGT